MHQLAPQSGCASYPAQSGFLAGELPSQSVLSGCPPFRTERGGTVSLTKEGDGNRAGHQGYFCFLPQTCCMPAASPVTWGAVGATWEPAPYIPPIL